MSTDSRRPTPPDLRSGGSRRVAVVGAGIVGLSTAWFLQEHGVQVTVLERRRVAAGASWGNAGWLTPDRATPLPEPGLLRDGARWLLDPASPVRLRRGPDPDLVRFLTGFARHGTARRWATGLRALAPLNHRALPAFDALADGGVPATTHDAEPFLAAFGDPAARADMLALVRRIERAGGRLEVEPLTGAEARALTPALSCRVAVALRVHGQRYLDPPAFVSALADAVRTRDGEVREHVTVEAVSADDAGALVTAGGEQRRFDAVVLATGAWLGEHARRFGVRQPVQAGRGYSFSVPVEHPPTGPIYLPAERVACSPFDGRLRVTGMMELAHVDAPLDPRGIETLVAAARPMLAGVDLESRTDEWVGARPVTSDGLPLIGSTRSSRVHVAGGHGMWGLTQGPVTGQLLAEAIATGTVPPELAPFDPLR